MHIARATKALRGTMATEMARFGCQPPQNLVLDALVGRDGLTPGELAKHLGASGPTAVKMAQRMEANGLVVRRRDDPDERLVRIYLTERGRELQGSIAAAVDHVAEAAVTGLDERDKETIWRILAVVRDNLARYPGDSERNRAPG
jgi:DNA-binding MarR family transcriptional regulator